MLARPMRLDDGPGRLIYLLTALFLGVLLLGSALSQAASAAAVPGSLRPIARLAGTSPVTLASAAAAANGLTPTQIRRAYGLPSRGAPGQTIAVVSAYDDPHAQADLNAYDAHFGLPACTSGNRCLRKLNQAGKPSPLPPADPTGGQWITESALGTEVAHGICESCRILLVEANTDLKADLSAAANTAATAGATVIVTSFVLAEEPFDPQYASDYSHPRAVVVAAVGDPPAGEIWGGTAASFPSAFPAVIAAGGTDLALSRNGGYGSETAWQGTVSGCSIYEQKPAWQSPVVPADVCPSRAVADVAAEADPGVPVLITGIQGPGGGPLYNADGTSVSAPIIAGVIGLAGSVGANESQMLYKHARSEPKAFHDIVNGENVPGCVNVICKAGPGWDGPTGLGTPNGLAAFLPSGGALSQSHPRVTISVPRAQLHANSRWVTHVTIKNGNLVAARGSIVVKSRVRIGGRSRVLTFARATVALPPVDSTDQRLVITHWRLLLKARGTVQGSIQLQVRGPAGGAVTVTKQIELHAP